MKKNKALPKEIYISWEDDGEDGFLSTRETTDNVEHGTKVSIYKLVAVKTQRVTEELV